MAEVAFLHYRPGNSLLHRLPPTAKLLLLLCFSIAQGVGPVSVLAAALPFLILGTLLIKPALGKMRGAVIFALIMALLLLFSDVRQTGAWYPGLLSGARFLLIFWTGILFTSCAHPAELGDAFHTLTHWIPLFPARRLKTHITLTLTFLPLIMDESATLDRAARNRCFHKRRNPYIRLRYRVEPLVEGIFRKSDDISRAMAARAYREE